MKLGVFGNVGLAGRDGRIGAWNLGICVLDQFTWFSCDFDHQVGPNQFRIDLSGAVFGVATPKLPLSFRMGPIQRGETAGGMKGWRGEPLAPTCFSPRVDNIQFDLSLGIGFPTFPINWWGHLETWDARPRFFWNRTWNQVLPKISEVVLRS